MSSKTENSAKEQEVLKGSNKFLHPKSRKCIAMVKKVKKESKKQKAKLENRMKQTMVAEKLLWFQKHMDQNVCPYTVELTATLVENYINRNDEELEQIQIKRSIGGNRNRQHVGRENVICMTKERERGDYESCGLEIPDILNITQCKMLKKWNGDLKFLPNFKFCRFSKRHLDEELKKKQRLSHAEKNIVGEVKDMVKEIVSKIESKANPADNSKNLINNAEVNENKAVPKVNEEQMDTE